MSEPLDRRRFLRTIGLAAIGAVALPGSASVYDYYRRRRRPLPLWVSVPVLIIYAIVWAAKQGGSSSRRSQDFGEARRRRPIGRPQATTQRSEWDALAEVDPEATVPAARAFFTRLVSAFQQAQGAGSEPEAFRPWAAPKVLEQLRTLGGENRSHDRRVVEVRVDELSVLDVVGAQRGSLCVRLAISLSYGVEIGNGRTRRYSIRQTWNLDREAGARWPKPEVARDLGCPACAKPVSLRGDQCAACGEKVLPPGRITWRIAGVVIRDRRPA